MEYEGKSGSRPQMALAAGSAGYVSAAERTEKKTSVNTATELRFQRVNQSINTSLSFYLIYVTRQLGAQPGRARARSVTDGRQMALRRLDQIYGGCRGMRCLSVGAATPDHSKCHSANMY